jgi:hypothetical protein
VFFRAASVSAAWQMLERIASLTFSAENVTAGLAAVMLIAAASMFVRKEWYARAMDGFAQCPFYVHAAALLAVAVTIQLLGGHDNAPFVYSRF